MIDSSPATSEPSHPKTALKAFTGLTAVQFLQLFSGLVTGPLIARALGAEGRGLLASIAVPLGLAPYVLQLGIAPFAVGAVTRGIPANRVFGSIGLLMVAVSLPVAGCAPLIATALSNGHPTVHRFIEIG